MKRIMSFVAVLGTVGLLAVAQEHNVVIERGTVVHGQAAPAMRANTGVRIMSMSTDPVKGAPYSAEAVNESIQTLADGNRITHTSKGMNYRDSEGRTRSDNTIAPVGSWMPESKEMTISNINDPVSGDHYMLDHSRKTAVKTNMSHMMPVVADMKKRVNVEVREDVRTTTAVAVAGSAATWTHKVEPPADMLIGPGPAVMMYDARGAAGMDVKKESLGKRVIEGVECDGTRETMTIEAGKIGNERPIQTVTERWYSEKLRQDVVRKTTDPRFGEINYKLTRITLSEQPRSFFEVPSDYQIEDMKNMMQFKMKAKEKEKE